MQKPLPDNIQQSLETEMHSSGGNRTPNPSKQVVTDPHLKALCNWYRHTLSSILKTVKHLTKFMHMFYRIISGESDGR